MRKYLSFSILAVLLLAGCSGNGGASVSDKMLDERIFADATQQSKAEYCLDINDDSLKGECVEVVSALDKTNAALQTGQEDLCNEISLDRYKEDCLKRLNENKNYEAIEAQKDAAKQKERDRMHEIIAQKDLNACKNLNDAYAYQCESTIYLNMAVAAKDPSICSKIGEEVDRQACRNLLQ